MIDSLAKEYKFTGDIKLRDKLFNELIPLVKEKSKYVYWYKSYKLYNAICKVKYLYNITEEDIFQELSLDVLTWIEKFNGTDSFRKYLFACLWHWKPKCINKEAYMNIKSIKCMNTANKSDLMDSLSKEIKYDIRMGITNLLEEVKSPKEKAVLKLLYINPDISKIDIASVLGVSKSRVTQIFNNLKNNKGLYDFIVNEL